MRHHLLIFVLALSILVVLSPASAGDQQPVGPSPVPEHVLIIVLDGFRPDYLDMYDTPALNRLRDDGAWVTDARGVFPANSTVNQTSLVTGAYPATTGIPNNTYFDRVTERFINAPRANRATTISEVFRDAGLATMSVGHYMLQGKTDTYATQFNDVVTALQSDNKPSLIVYLNLSTDSAGHSFGPYHPQTEAAVKQADAEIGRLLAVLEDENILDHTLVIVASDHGMSVSGGKQPVPGLDYVLWRQGFSVAKSAAEILPETDLIQIQLGSAFLYFRQNKYSEERYEQLLAALQNAEGLDVYSTDRLRENNTDPYFVGDIVVAPLPGYTLYPGSGNSGIHGRPAEQQITLLLYGPGIKKGVTIPRADIVDIVPTVLHLFRLSPPETVDGRVITQALQ